MLLILVLLTGIPLDNFAQGTQKNDVYLISSEDFFLLDLPNHHIHLEEIDHSLLQAAIFHATNDERKVRGLPAFIFSKEAEAAASFHAKDMVKLKFYSHTSPVKSRKTLLDRLSAQGINPHYFGENIGKTFGIQYEEGQKIIKPKIPGEFRYWENPQAGPIPPPTYVSFARKIVKLWMDSPGHRQNILNKHFTHLGCGTFADFEKKFYNAPYIMAVQNFVSASH